MFKELMEKKERDFLENPRKVIIITLAKLFSLPFLFYIIIFLLDF